MSVVSDGADSRLMLKGYDPVAYFTDGRPVPGKPEIKTEHRGVTYRFSGEDHRQLFVFNPSKYSPQYGGFCAQGIGFAIPLPGEPEIFKIVDGRLFVFAAARSRLYFEMDQERSIKLADQYWENEVRDSDWRWQTLKRVWLWKVPHYKSEQQLAEEYARRAK